MIEEGGGEGEGGSNWPPTEKTTLKKPSLISVKDLRDVTHLLKWKSTFK